MAMDWFRSHHGAPTDPKWVMIARRANVTLGHAGVTPCHTPVTPGHVASVWWSLLDHASQHSERGSVADFDSEELAAFFGYEQEQVEAILAALRDKDLITADERIAKWEKRQPDREDTTAAERKRRQRERERLAREQQGHDAMSRHVTHGHKMSRLDSDTDTDKREEGGVSAHAHVREREAPETTDLGKTPSQTLVDADTALEAPADGEVPDAAEALAIAQAMWDGISKEVPGAKKPYLPAWARELQSMVVAGTSYADVRSMWDWVRHHDFWGSRIVEPRQMREHWNKLCAQRAKELQGPRKTKTAASGIRRTKNLDVIADFVRGGSRGEG